MAVEWPYPGLNDFSFELMGRRGNLTMTGSTGVPTKVLFGTTWARVHQHPGQYLRGRYGPGYLQHSQSWRMKEGMSGASDTYNSGTFTHCEDETSHACLELYPTDGNWLWLPHRYP